MDDTLVWPLLDSIRLCLCTELTETPGGAPCVCTVLPGQEVAADFCDCQSGTCGMGWVRLDSLYASTQFPAADNRATTCAAPYAARIHIGVHRCLPVMNPGGQAPTALQQTEAARIQMGDMAALRRVLECCDAITNRARVVGAYTPASQGGCGGGYWPVTVQVM